MIMSHSQLFAYGLFDHPFRLVREKYSTSFYNMRSTRMLSIHFYVNKILYSYI